MTKPIRAAAVALFITAVTAGHASAAPAVVPGWPVGAPAGTVHAGPGGGVTVIADTIEAVEDPLTGVFAFGSNGRPRWRQLIGCSLGPDCQIPAAAPGLLPDGSFGPIVHTDGPAGVAPTGAAIDPGCGGAPLADGTCVSATVPTAAGATVRASRAGNTIWTFTEPGLRSMTPASVDLPPVLTDSAGDVYVGFRDDAADGQGRILAADPATGTVRWRRDGVDALTGLGHGVLALTPSHLIALAPDGSATWTRPRSDLGLVTADLAASSVAAIFDRASGHVYLAQRNDAGRVVALDAATGRELWHTAVARRTAGGGGGPDPIVSVGPTGTVYLAAVRGGHGLLARAPDGRKLWQYRTATPVTGARELADGTVALAVERPQQNIGSIQGVLIRINPRKVAPTPTHTRVSLDRRTVRMNCADLVECLAETGDGAIIRVDTPRATQVRLRVRNALGGVPDRRNPPGFRNTITWTAPGGTTYMRVLDLGNSGGETIDPGGTGDGIVRPGRYLIEVSWPDGTRRQVRRIGVNVVVTHRGPALPGID